MISFLKIVAKDLLGKFGSNLSDIAVVFPNKRASLFLNEELIMQSGGNPVWSPQYYTISDLFRSCTDTIVADQIKLICELYRHYSNITGSSESLDDFYGWGEMMLSDFDDLDKNMGNAEMIFENTSQIHEYDDVDFLSETQKDILKRFFHNFSEDQSSILKKNFMQLWNNLGNIYTSFRQSLSEQNLAYEGMLYRQVVESGNATSDMFKARKYVFVGFNLIQKVEQQLFQMLAKEDKALFYWDYDKYYMDNDNEAGKYIREYMRHFPNEITDASVYNNFTKKPQITYISASSEDIQARYVSQWLTEERIKAGKRTAIVMGDEKLLPTILHCLPDTVEDVNITTGYPLSQTPVATFIKQVFALKLSGISRARKAMRLRQVNNVLRHPYMKYVSDNAIDVMTRLNEQHTFYPTLKDLAADEFMEMLFTPLSDKNDADNNSRNSALLNHLLTTLKRIAHQSKSENNSKEYQLMHESLFRMHQVITRINTLIESGELNIGTITLQGLLGKIIRSTTVPFHGEPIIGIQVMGVLETRNLDFDHILILSANEGNIPKGVDDSSFIPHFIRKAYQLTTVDNKVSIFAYYFHRMMQRAGDVTLTYNGVSSDMKASEKSRFMMQLMAESPLKIDVKTITNPIIIANPSRTPIEKTAEVIQKMENMDRISASSINTYQRCQMQFFYKVVCGIQDNNESDEDEMDSRIFGLIFHKAAELLYRPFENKTIQKSDIEAMLKDPSVIERAIDEGFRIELFKMTDENSKRRMPALDGVQTINRKVLIRLVRSLLNYDMNHCPFQIIGLEKDIWDKITFTTDTGKKELAIKGFIDRLDIITDSQGKKMMRIVDYKTGRNMPEIKSVDEIFSAPSHKHPDYFLQTFLYCKMLACPAEGEPFAGTTPVAPALLYPLHCRKKDYDPVLTFGNDSITDILPYMDEYNSQLTQLMTEIFDYTTPFMPTEDKTKCERCFYSEICGKKK